MARDPSSIIDARGRLLRGWGSLLAGVWALIPAVAFAGEEATVEREVFRTFGAGKPIFYALAALTLTVFFYGVWKQVKKYRRGRPADRMSGPLLPRLAEAAVFIGTHMSIRRKDNYVGVAHGLVFYGFLVLVFGTALVGLDEDMIQILGGPKSKLLVGNLYLVFSAVLDLFGLLFLVGLVMLMVRRGRPPAKLDYKRVDLEPGAYDRSSYRKGDALFLWLLFLIGVTGFLIEGSRIAATGHGFERWSFVGWGLAAIGGKAIAADSTFAAIWWIHVGAALGFIAYLPFSKAMHMVTDLFSLASRDLKAGIALPPVEEGASSPGIAKMEDFSWRQLLSFDACTKCGRCHEMCPARTSGAPLSPRDLILDLREQANNAFGASEILGRSRPPAKEGPVAGGWISAQTLWSCTTCRACVEVCPVGVEHVVDIVQMRRALIDQGSMEDGLQDALRGLDEKGNSFGESARKRAAWSKKLDFKITDAVKKPVKLLWFLGDFAAYNASCAPGTRTFAEVLQAAGVDFGVMGAKEKSAGNDVRRVGEEGLFEVLATDNIKQLSSCEFERIVTTDPHTFNTLKNEYPALGGKYDVVHYSTLLRELIEDGTIKLPTILGARVTYHDPCYLGRYNGIYDDPRAVLEACGVEIVEMPRNRELSFCCGAGGGRVWMADPESMTERPSEMRIREAVALGVDTFVVACPKDMTMYADAVKTSGNEGKIVVRDLVDIVAEAMRGSDE